MKTGLKFSVTAASIWGGVNACKDDCADDCHDAADDCCCKIQNHVNGKVLPERTASHYLEASEKAKTDEEALVQGVLTNVDISQIVRDELEKKAVQTLRVMKHLNDDRFKINTAVNNLAQSTQSLADNQLARLQGTDGSTRTVAAAASSFNHNGGPWAQPDAVRFADYLGTGQILGTFTSTSGTKTLFNNATSGNNFDISDHRNDKFVYGSVDLEHSTADANKNCSGACEAFCQNYGCGEVFVLLGLFQKSSYNGHVTYDADYERVKGWLSTRDARNVLKAEQQEKIAADDANTFCQSTAEAAKYASKAHTLNVGDGAKAGETMIKGYGSKSEAFLRDWMYKYFTGDLVQTITTSNLGTRCQTTCNQGCKAATSTTQMGQSDKQGNANAVYDGSANGPEVVAWGQLP